MTAHLIAPPPMQSVPATAQELLALHDESFVRAAYIAVLGREADPGGLENYLRQVRGEASKEKVLVELALSSDGRQAASALPGLSQAIKSFQRRERSWWWSKLSRLFRREALETQQPLQAQLHRIEMNIGSLIELSSKRFSALEAEIGQLRLDLSSIAFQQPGSDLNSKSSTPLLPQTDWTTPSSTISENAQRVYSQLRRQMTSNSSEASKCA